MRSILIFSAALLLFGCGEKKDDANTFEEINKSVQSVITDMQKGASDAVEKADEISQKADKIGDDIAQKTAETKQTVQDALKSAEESGKDILQKANETLSTVGKKADEAINASAQTIDAVKQKADNIVQAASAPLTNADKGKKLFATCIPCHGTKAEKSAVNKSQIINKWSKEQILKSLKGYKDGTYGGAFKATMIPTVKRLSDDDMEELSAYIAALGE